MINEKIREIDKKIPDFNDLIFENRNREYGAYLLRKEYNRNIIFSILIGSILVSLLVLIPFISILAKKKNSEADFKMRYVQVEMEKYEPPKEALFIPPPPAPPSPEMQTSIKYVAPVVVDTLLVNDKIQPSVAEVEASKSDIGHETGTAAGRQDESLIGPGGEMSDEPFMIVEVPPTFQGGDINKFRDWVQKRTIYPQIALDNNKQGKVQLTFVIERDGSVSDVKILKGVDRSIDEEAVKTIMGSPKWSPGLQRGRPVKVRCLIFLNFIL
jgi:protein TonB